MYSPWFVISLPAVNWEQAPYLRYRGLRRMALSQVLARVLNRDCGSGFSHDLVQSTYGAHLWERL